MRCVGRGCPATPSATTRWGLQLHALAYNLANVLRRQGKLAEAEAEIRRALALLEDRLGIQLVRSLTPQLELTAVGERYLGAVQQFFAQVRDGLYEHTAQARARLHVTAPQSTSPSIFCMSQLVSGFPGSTMSSPIADGEG